MKLKKELKVKTHGTVNIFALSEEEQALFFNSLFTNILEELNKKEKKKWKLL